MGVDWITEDPARVGSVFHVYDTIVLWARDGARGHPRARRLRRVHRCADQWWCQADDPAPRVVTRLHFHFATSTSSSLLSSSRPQDYRSRRHHRESLLPLCFVLNPVRFRLFRLVFIYWIKFYYMSIFVFFRLFGAAAIVNDRTVKRTAEWGCIDRRCPRALAPVPAH